MQQVAEQSPVRPTAALDRAPAPLRVLIALSGLHKVVRGAETAFEAVGLELSRLGHDVTLIGSGREIAGRPYRFLHAASVPREWFARLPGGVPYLRSHYAYEELTFAPNLWAKFRPADYDVTVTCGYPYTNWTLNRRKNARRPPHVFVTQNGDHMATARQFDYRAFACDGLVCTNPEYFERNRGRYRCALIPNGVDPSVFRPGPPDRAAFGLPEGRPVALMVSALIASKRVVDGIRAAAKVKDLALVVAGDGELRKDVEALGAELMPGRFFRLSLPRERMPALYRSADAFLHMSVIEASANAYMEALATGLPVVTHDWAVTRWTLEDTGLLVDATNVDAVAAALQEAVGRRSEQDVAKRRDLIERRFAWKSIAKSYEAFFGEVIANK